MPAAYVHVVEPEPPPEPPPQPSAPQDVLQEAMRLNTEIAKVMVERFPEMLRASAELLRAAEAAGLPAREGCAIGPARRRAARGRALATLLSPVVNALTSTLAVHATEDPAAETTAN